MMTLTAGTAFRNKINQSKLTSLLGIYDMLSASVASQYSDGMFISGFGFGASHYGLPDIGFIAWPDIVNFVQRLRGAFPTHHLLIDIDDGYCDPEVACHVVRQLELVGASGVILEDQKRPRKCGHFGGKQILDLPEYLDKLNRVLETRKDLVVVARTDASEHDEVLRRVEAFGKTSADVILADGLKDLNMVKELKAVSNGKPILFNQIAGGKSPAVTLTELEELGFGVVIYSTPCLFAAQAAMHDALKALKAADGKLPTATDTANFIGVSDCTELLQANIDRVSDKIKTDKVA